MSKLNILALASAALIPTTALADWNGWYMGGGISAASNLSYDITANIDPDVDFEDTNGFGAFFGMHRAFPSFVLGYEVALEIPSDAEEFGGDATIDYLLDLKLTGGVPAGDALVYGIVSLSGIYGSYGPNDINATGIGLGAGAAFKLNDNVSISAEYIARSATQEFDVTDVDATADTLALRAAYHF